MDDIRSKCIGPNVSGQNVTGLVNLSQFDIVLYILERNRIVVDWKRDYSGIGMIPLCRYMDILPLSNR